jgi:cell division septal protein FtsQ
MRKKKELPRRRRRFVKRIIFFLLVLLIVILIAGGISFYFFEVKMQKLYPATATVTRTVTTNQPDKTYIALQAGLNKDQIEYTTITKGNGSYIVVLKNGGKVTFSAQKDIMTQIASLQYILSHLTMEGRQFSTLDLRFDQPVIVLVP